MLKTERLLKLFTEWFIEFWHKNDREKNYFENFLLSNKTVILKEMFVYWIRINFSRAEKLLLVLTKSLIPHLLSYFFNLSIPPLLLDFNPKPSIWFLYYVNPTPSIWFLQYKSHPFYLISFMSIPPHLLSDFFTVLIPPRLSDFFNINHTFSTWFLSCQSHTFYLISSLC